MEGLINSDVVIIGCGAGGFTSALALAEKGKKVVIISERTPSVVLFSGAGYDYNTEKREDFINAISFFKKIIEPAGYPLSFSERKLSLLTESGGIIPTELFSSTSSISELDSLLDRRVLLIGIEGLSRFIPEYITWRIKKYTNKPLNGWSSARIRVKFKDTPEHFTSITLSKALDIKENFFDFLNVLLNQNNIQSYDVILFPPVFGFQNYNENFNKLKSNLKPSVGELLSSIPSVHGIRLYNAMERALRERNLKVIEGRCSEYNGDRRIESLNVILKNGEKIKVEGRIFIYAPGRFTGGGITSGKEIKESLFGLPLYHNERQLNSYFHSLFTYNYNDTQPCLNAGIPVNINLQPLKEDGNIFAINLYAAGSIIDMGLYNGITASILSGYLCAGASYEY